MYTQEEILQMLAEGKDAGTIAQEFVAVLNGAIHQQEKAAEEKSEKYLAAKKLMEETHAFVKTYYPNIERVIASQFQVEKFIKTLEGIILEAEANLELQSQIDSFCDEVQKGKVNFCDEVPKGHIQLKGNSDAIEAFLHQVGLK